MPNQQDKLRDTQNEKKRDSGDYEPIGGLYDDKREHGTRDSQHVDEGTKERDKQGNKSAPPHPNAGGSPTRGHSSDGDAATGHGNQ